MAAEVGQIFVDSKTVAVAGTPEALTTRDLGVRTSVFILPKPGNGGNLLVVDDTTATKTFIVPTSGITLPIGNPSLIQIDVSVGGEGCDWIAV